LSQTAVARIAVAALMSLSQPVQYPPAGVVTGLLVLGARVSEAKENVVRLASGRSAFPHACSIALECAIILPGVQRLTLACAKIALPEGKRGKRAVMVSYTIIDGIFVLQLAGEININSLTETRNKVDSFKLEQYDKIVINLEKVSFFDSSGLGYLVVLIKQVKMNQGSIAFCSPNNLVQRLLSTIRIDKYVKIFDTQDEALNYLKQPPEGAEGL
jgi:anti-anti-sigma factor